MKKVFIVGGKKKMKITLRPCGHNVEELKHNDLQNTVYFADGVTFANGKMGQIEISRTAQLAPWG